MHQRTILCRLWRIRVSARGRQGYQRVHTWNRKEARVLLCGDGDLSYGASIAQELQEKKTQLTVTVLESQDDHFKVYSDSEKNVDIIQSHGHLVRFETDATKLEDFTDLDGPFDRIQFNFPHWRGKTNTRHNRTLLDNFFASSSKVLCPTTGQVHVALMDHQGGAVSRTVREWKQSWMAAKYAAQHGLLLVDVVPFEPTYKLSSYQWRDRSFRVRGEPQMYMFCTRDNPSKCHAPRHLQLYCYFRLLMRHEKEVLDPRTTAFLLEYIQDRIPEGWRAQVQFLDWIDGNMLKNSPHDCLWGAFTVAFCGQERPMDQTEAEKHRLRLVEDMQRDGMPARSNWVISNPCPYPLLQHYSTPHTT